MSDFDINEYLRRKNSAPGVKPSKLEDIVQARQNKINQLDQFQADIAIAGDAKRVSLQQDVAEGRTTNEMLYDVGLSAMQGFDTIAKLPAMVVDKATEGNFYGTETQNISKMSDDREKLKSAFAQAIGQENAAIAQEAGAAAKAKFGDGALGTTAQVATEFGVSFWEALKDPETLPDQIAQQIASLGLMGKVGRSTEIATRGLAAAAPKLAATKAGQMALEKSGTAGAVGFGAVLQGTDVGSDTMARLMELPQELWDQNPEYVEKAKELGPEAAKQFIASELASKATLKAGAASLLTAALPGGTAIEKALVNRRLGGYGAVPKAIAGESVQEGIEEGTGAVAGNMSVQEINPEQSLAEGVGTAAGQGSFMGAVLGGGLTTGRVFLTNQAEKAVKRAVGERPDPNKLKAMQEAVASGNIDSLTTVGSPTYSPSAAIASLFGNGQIETATPEVRQANLERAGQVLADLQTRRDTLASAIEGYTPAALAQYQTQLAEAQAQSDTETVTMLQEAIASATNTQQIAKDKTQLESLDKELAKAQQMFSVFNQENVPKDLDVDAEVAAVNGQDPVASQAAAGRLINLSMATPERLSDVLATQMANNASNGLSEAQRIYLRSFSAARQAENRLKDMGKVSQEVYYGSKPGAKGNRYIGLANYRANMGAAINAGNQALADNLLSLLSNFEASHQGKAEAAARAQATGVDSRIERAADGTWAVKPGFWSSDKARRENGGLNIGAGATKLVEDVRTEAAAVSATATELRAAYGLRFTATNSGGTNNVQNVSQAPQVVQEEAPSTAAPSTAPIEGSAADQGRAIGDGATDTDVRGNEESAADAAVETVSAETQEAPASAVNTATDAVTEDQLQSTEESSTPVDETANESMAAESGKLSALQQTSPEGTPFNLRNLIAEYFTQTAGREGDTTQRPLVAMKNFLSQGAQNVLEFVGLETLTEAQQRALDTFRTKASDWQSTIEKSLFRKKQPFWSEDMVQFLIQDTNGKLDLEENVKTAMSYAAFSWIAENASRDQTNSNEEINRILEREDDALVSQKERAALGEVGTRQNAIINALGQRAVQALGFRAKKDAPKDLMPRLESALGTYIMKMLLDQGILTRTTLSGAQMAALTKSENTKQAAQFNFLRLAQDANGNLNEQAEQVFRSVIGSQGILDKLFSVEAGLKEPSLEPIPFTQQKTQGTNQKVPEKLAKILEAKNAEANYVRQDMLKLVGLLGDKVALAIAGVTETTPGNTHRTNRDSLKATNDGLKREFDRFKQFVGSMADNTAALYFEHTVWKQQRVGIATNAINPQTSKIHRYMLYRQSWDTKVELNDAAQMDNFRLRVLEGMGVKTDKQSNVKSLSMYSGIVNTPEVQAAVEALRKGLYDNAMSEQDQQSVLKAVQAGGENFHSLDALVALAHEAQAIKTGQPSFNVQMMGEVDGVTNGPMLTHLLLGAASSVQNLFGLLNRGGFYEVGSTDTQYNQWREGPGKMDLYEVTAQHMTEAVQRLLGTNPQMSAALNAIYAFTGPLNDQHGSVTKAGRNIIKTPLTAMVFGSSVMSAVDSMADNFVKSVYAGIEDVAAGKADLKTTLDHINTLLKAGKAQPLPNMPITRLMEQEFTEAQVAALKKAFKGSLGKAVEATMQEDFAEFIAQRQDFNASAQLAFDLYNAAYTGIRDTYVQEQIAAGKIAVNDKDQPLHDLSQEQENELRGRLRKLTPVMHTLMSKDSGSLAGGLYASKSDRKISTKSTHESKIRFGDNTYTTARGMESVESEPGVAMAVLSIHSTDSAISHNAADGNEVLNIHDAHGSGLGNFAQTAQNLNKETFEAMLNYSPANEMAEMLSRTVIGLAQLVKDGSLSPEVMKNVQKTLADFAKKNDLEPEAVLAVVMNNARFMANKADRMKLETLSQMGSVDQYALEGGNYEVTDADRAAASEKLAGLNIGLTPNEQAALDSLASALGNPVPAVAPARTEPKPAATVTDAFGPVGQSAIPSDPDLVAFFEANPNATAQQVLALLGQPNRLNRLNRMLLNLVGRAVSPNLRIRFVTPKTAESEVLEKPTEASRGWFVVKNDQEAIYVLSPEFENSGLTAETLLHELVHASLAKIIANPTGDAVALVADLESLLTQAKAYVEANGLTQYDPALGSVQELVSWGMTNLSFQRDVLTKFEVESKTTKNKLITAMQSFIDTLASLLFKRPDRGINTGLGVLISNVSGLFAEATQKKQAQAGNLNLSQASTKAVNEAIDAYTTLDIHQALDNGRLKPEFKQHLANLLGGIVERLHGPYGAFAASMRKTEAGNPLAVWLKAIETGKAPFASSILASNFAGTAQEDFAMQQVEATVKAALEGNDALTKTAYRELSKLYLEARAKLKPSDFASQEDYDFVFKLESTNGNRSDYLSRFAALGLANQQFNELLKFATERDTRPVGAGQTFTERLMNVFDKIVAFFNQKITATFGGQDADAKLEALVTQLVDIEAKKRHLLKLRANSTAVLEPVENGIKDLAEVARKKVGQIAGSSIVQNSKSGIVRGVGGLTRTIANDQVELFLNGMRKLRDTHWKERDGILASLVSELTGPAAKLSKLLRETKHIETLRKATITQHAKLSLQTFANKGKDLTDNVKASISSVFLRTGLHNLLGRYSLAEIENLLNNPTAINMEIAKLESELTSRIKDRHIEQANALGYYKATGLSRNPVLMMNAHLISQMAGTEFKSQITAAQAKQAEPVIAQLVSLYALKYSSAMDQAMAKNTMRTENARSDGNGVEFVLKLHKEMEAESLEKLFKGNPALMIHGYTPEILNPHTAIKIADEVDGKDLVNRGYSVGAALSNDKADPDKAQKRIYVLRDGGLAPWLSAVFSLSSMKAKGAKKHNGYLNVTTQNGLDNATMQAEITNAKLNELKQSADPRRDLSKDKENHLVPVYNDKGEIVNWRYMMAEATKDNLLERDNRFDNVIGALAGSIYDKPAAREQNQKAITVLREQYEADFALNQEAYIDVGSRSTDPEMRQLWDMLPDATKEDVRKIWGQDKMWVRKDSLDIMFGYRKLTLASMFQKDPEARNKLEQLFVSTVEGVFSAYAGSKHGLSPEDAEKWAKRAAVYITRGERGWQELVREAKDIIVVKTGFVLMGNIWSNLSFLAMAGVPLKDILGQHQVAIKGATSYERDTNRLAEIQTLLSTGYVTDPQAVKELNDEAVILRDAIDRNPVRELIEAGLMPTIVEDVAAENDPYSYKSELVRKTEGLTDKLNPTIREAAKMVYMTKDGQMYQTLSKITRLSDFVARYTLYQHLISRKNNPLSREDAIQEASDAFVNYDIPMHRGMQYADEMGILTFTKYFLRIQRVLLKLARENPARVLGTVALGNLVDLGPIVLDSSLVTRIGNNPLEWGAFNYVGALDELATINAPMALVK